MTKENKKTNDVYDKLIEPFPKEAYDEETSRGFPLTTIDAYHVIERLNNVLGLCGTAWKLEVREWIEKNGEIIAICQFHYDLDTEKPKSFPCVGGKKIIHENYTDGYKSAMTNAICKGASFLGVGLSVYKDEYKKKKDVSPDSNPSSPKNKYASPKVLPPLIPI